MENVLLQRRNDDFVIKITDFGLAKDRPDVPLTTLCGTPYYIAPEIVQSKSYGNKVDCWSLGVILFTMLAGRCARLHRFGPRRHQDGPPDPDTATLGTFLSGSAGRPGYLPFQDDNMENLYRAIAACKVQFDANPWNDIAPAGTTRRLADPARRDPTAGSQPTAPSGGAGAPRGIPQPKSSSRTC